MFVDRAQSRRARGAGRAAAGRHRSPVARRSRAALVLIVCAASLVVASALASAAGRPVAPRHRSASPLSRPGAVTPGSTYLALGDSVTFGYEEPQVVPTPDYSNPSSFLGYPEQLGSELHLNVVNAACPGETSASLIDVSAQSNGCENSVGNPSAGYRKLSPLHVRYSASQLSYVLAYLRTYRNVRLVSLMIGANDFYICQETTKDQCASSAELQAVFTTLARNVGRILSAIRDKAHYRGQLAIVNYYSLNYASTADDAVSTGLNEAMDAGAKPFHVVVADGYSELEAAAAHSGGNTCTAGLLTQLGSPGNCGIHPSYAGQALLAQALEKVIRL